jgi:CTD kinase subunit alpha
MPPPSSLPISSSSASFGASGAEAHGDTLSQSSSTNLGAKGKKGGFKPIAQASSLKRFFPGDEDEEDVEAHASRPASHVIPLPSSLPKKPSSAFAHGEQLVAKEVDIRIAQNGTSYVEKMEILARQMSQHPLEHQSSPMAISPSQTASGRVSDAGLLPRPDEHRKQEQQPNQDLPRRNRDNSRFEGSFEESVHAPEATMPPTPEQETAEFYKIVSQVGEGTFGKVYKAKNASSGRFVALKRIRMEAEKDGFPVTAMREIKLLQSLQHPNVIQLYEMMVSNGA